MPRPIELMDGPKLFGCASMNDLEQRKSNGRPSLGGSGWKPAVAPEGQLD